MKPTQKESPRSELQSRNYDRNGAEGLDLGGIRLLTGKAYLRAVLRRKYAFQKQKRILGLHRTKYAFILEEAHFRATQDENTPSK